MSGRRGISKTNNILLSLLSDQDQPELISSMEEIELKQNDVLFQPSQEIEHVYFFNSGLSSEIAVNADGIQIEVGCAGREGMSGVPAVLGVGASQHLSFMQVGGSALRMLGDDFSETFASHDSALGAPQVAAWQQIGGEPIDIAYRGASGEWRQEHLGGGGKPEPEVVDSPQQRPLSFP